MQAELLLSAVGLMLLANSLRAAMHDDLMHIMFCNICAASWGPQYLKMLVAPPPGLKDALPDIDIMLNMKTGGQAGGFGKGGKEKSQE